MFQAKQSTTIKGRIPICNVKFSKWVSLTFHSKNGNELLDRFHPEFKSFPTLQKFLYVAAVVVYCFFFFFFFFFFGGGVFTYSNNPYGQVFLPENGISVTFCVTQRVECQLDHHWSIRLVTNRYL